MNEMYENLLNSFDKAIKKKEEKKFNKEHINEIYDSASKLFDGTIELEQSQIETIRDKWILLAEGRLSKSSAMAKLQGTSRAEAIQSVLLSTL